jgi:Rieske Fe-S protein
VTEPPVLIGTVAGRQLHVPVDLTSPLAVIGGVARSQGQIGIGLHRDVLIARVSMDAFSVLSASCTHEGCVVSRFEAPVFVCPCHGSQYDLFGNVVRGPAPAALPQLPSSYASGILTISL